MFNALQFINNLTFREKRFAIAFVVQDENIRETSNKAQLS
jgi:hypothetical protein